jgi:hypothetical protein
MEKNPPLVRLDQLHLIHRRAELGVYQESPSRVQQGGIALSSLGQPPGYQGFLHCHKGSRLVLPSPPNIRRGILRSGSSLVETHYSPGGDDGGENSDRSQLASSFRSRGFGSVRVIPACATASAPSICYSRDKDDGDLGSRSPHLGCHLQPSHARHLKIYQDQIEGLCVKSC